MSKLSLAAAAAVGYVLGARAGRARYDQIVRTSRSVWHSAPVQKAAGLTRDAARAAAPVAARGAADAASRVTRRVPGLRGHSPEPSEVAGNGGARTSVGGSHG